MKKPITALCGVLLAMAPGLAGAVEIRGDYIEARTADVFTGPCFSNAEVFITGHQAVMAWKVQEGAWDGVDLGGLTVAAALRGTTTFSEDDPAKARAILIVDRQADARQRDALIALAKHLGGDRLANVVEVREAKMNLSVERRHAHGSHAETHHGMPQAPKAAFTAAGVAEIRTRPLNENDHFCGNEVIAYQPLSQGVDVKPAYTLGHSYKGTGLNTNWDDPNCRSSFVGQFSY